MITLIGANGSMGKRYQAIMNAENITHRCFDKEDWIGEIHDSVRDSERTIIATPTDTHFDLLNVLLPTGKPILCEKPISKNLDQVRMLIESCKHHNFKLTMMMQYSKLNFGLVGGKLSRYDYFRTGPDGMPWDALQIIALANGPIEIDNKSPVWKCEINGAPLSLADMDQAYIDFFDDWQLGVHTIYSNLNWILRAHEKVARMAGAA